MPALPKAFTDTLQGLPGFREETFLRVHESPERVTSIRLQRQKITDVKELFPQLETTPVPWTSGGYYLSSRPSFTFDPYFHAGAYYVQEASSMFLEEAIRQTTGGEPLKALDLCAAPGGKSTLIQGILHADSVLVANEVIKARAALLADNLTKWGAANVVVTNNDPRDFARLPEYFDLVAVDAPCSGSGLFRRDPEAVEEWSQDNVMLCSQRQQRILADVFPALRPGGVLIYSTCSYAVEEDEQIMDWLVENFGMENIPLQLRPGWHIVETASGQHHAKGYRFYPDQVKGEGFFIACFRKPGTAGSPQKFKAGFSALPKKEAELVLPWLRNGAEMALMAHNGEAIALTLPLAKEMPLLQKQLYIRKAGVKAGQLTAKELVPDHQLAVSNCVAEGLPAAELSQEQALRYLRKEDLALENAAKGWNLMRFNGKNLGWAKVLPNRVNNYYPKELRILKAGTPDL
ncbi:RNA methyltransferase [Chitinophaga sp. GCM10012297]|uniref:rRNA cytosine-C5-methyltransferase n=1 Tax=Chitinophaga chungangae TaxID=2821488 RepID=A0ABS3Y911_9BACT|nr:rRNA cytosine-C5-methyltransferase [Chitinophaga chungangae]MBO9151172.1 rRNA cytosine-C5-methyltransferase [Chitinophaga chungangae]